MNSAADDLLAAVLRGSVAGWPSRGAPGKEAFIAAARRHAVQSLVARQLRKSAAPGGWPGEVYSALHGAALQHAAMQPILDADLTRVLDAFAAQGIESLLLKGAALAHTHYPHPCLRPRTDTDLLIADAAVAATSSVMIDLGYERFNQVSGDVVRYQMAFVKTGPAGVRHFYDIHWRLSDRQRFAALPAFAECRVEAVPVPALGPHARTLGAVHALIAACVHRVAHHDDEDERLIWIYDIDLLARSMHGAERGEFVRQAVAHDVAAACARGLTLAESWLGTPVADLRDPLAGHDTVAEAAYLGRSMGPIDVLVSDLRTLGTWRERTRLVREHLFPPPAYVMQHYRGRSAALLPAYYLHRLVTGAGRWLRHSR